ncbi:MAG: hydantoinase/oxoprolinase family protein [Rhodopseudomonas sp.]|nr:hydantoinase/oxoprolinase family protein [Rhodopseudomonas sp.]
MLRVSVDIGGTFTDMVITEPGGSVEMFKSPSTHGSLSDGVMNCLRKAAKARNCSLDALLAEVDTIIHGTTATTNALLTRSGVKTGMLTTKGFRDIIELRRGMRVGVSPYNLKVKFPEALVPRARRIGIDERVGPDGAVMTPLDEAQVEAAVRSLKDQGCEAVAICFLYSYIRPEHELRAAEIARTVAPDMFVATSYDTIPSSREFERFNTTVVGAYVGAIFAAYIDQLDAGLRQSGFKGHLLLIQSNGGIQDRDTAKRNPVTTLLSGPSAGPSVGLFFGNQYSNKIISADMGGTSFEAALIQDNQILLTSDTWLSEQRIAAKMVDVHSIGAGGGSIASFDSLDLLRVGPKSAGSRPGPACYGRGGAEPTVTDANVLLGYIDPEFFLGGEMLLDRPAAEAAMDPIARRLDVSREEAAFAVYDVVNEGMADALNERCTKRGFDPREFLLVAGGGAGGLHVVEIAKKAGMKRVLIPKFASAYCAFGMQLPDFSQDYVRTYSRRIAAVEFDAMNALYEEMEAEGRLVLLKSGARPDQIRFERTADLRYVGQFHEVEVPCPAGEVGAASIDAVVASFHHKHEQTYAFSMQGRHVEVVYLRVRAIAQTPAIRLKEIAKGASSAVQARKAERLCFFGKRDGWQKTEVYEASALVSGNEITGPALIEEAGSTILVPNKARAEIDAHGNYLIHV